MTTIPDIAHVAVTVSDYDVSLAWYTKLFDRAPDLDEDTGPFRHTIWVQPNGQLFAFHTFPKGVFKPGRFDELTPGLDHIGFLVSSRDVLEAWAKHLDELGIEHGKIVEASYGSGLAFRDPDNIQLEFFAPPAQ
ncbi:MAG: VOC family protein [Actinomycetota bacterium]